MTLREDDASTNGDNIQEAMAEVEETAEVEGTTGSVNLNESLEVDEEENGIKFDLNASTIALEQEQEMSKDEKQLESKKMIVRKQKNEKNWQSNSEGKSILRLQNQLSKHFDASRKTESTLKQIQEKLSLIDKIAIVTNKQHEIIRKMQVQVYDIQRRLAKIDKSNTGPGSKASPKSKSGHRVEKNNKYNKSKTLKKRSSRTKQRK